MDISKLTEHLAKLQALGRDVILEAKKADQVAHAMVEKVDHSAADPLVFGLTVFLLACFVGYYVVWRVTPALHSPLMSVTNAISSVIIVGALIAAGPALASFSTTLGLFAVFLAAINIFGGFTITHRMLSMFSKNK